MSNLSSVTVRNQLRLTDSATLDCPDGSISSISKINGLATELTRIEGLSNHITSLIVHSSAQNNAKTFHGLSLSNIDIQNSDYLSSMIFTQSTLSGSNFTGSTLAGSNFTNSTLNSVDFTQSDLRNSNFTNADITNATFNNTMVLGSTGKTILHNQTNYGDAISGDDHTQVMRLNGDGNVLIRGSIDTTSGNIIIQKYNHNNTSNSWTFIDSYSVDANGSTATDFAISNDGRTIAVANKGTATIHIFHETDIDDSFNTSHRMAMIIGETTHEFGHVMSLSPDGTVLAVGAPNGDHTEGTNTYGYVRVYQTTDNGYNWNRLGDFDTNTTMLRGPSDNSRFGDSVACDIDDNGIIYVAIGMTNETGAGSSYASLYEYDSGSDEWSLVTQSNHETAMESFGSQVALSMSGTTPRFAVAGKRVSIEDGLVHVIQKSANSSSSLTVL